MSAPLPSSDDATADANLLFGIVAAQMDFISRDDLIAAAAIWVEDKSQSLAQILADRGILARDERQLLEALVEKFLQKNDFDAKNCLARLSSIGPLRQQLERLHDDDVDQTLAFLATSPSSTIGDGVTKIDLTLGARTSTGARFRIIRPHARGGLGQVSYGRDEELDREVAIKEILPEIAGDADVRGRFLQEAEITGKLQHPGIVPVYGLGTYDDGRPFYAMRFVEGKSLLEAINEFHQKDYEDWRTGRGNIELRDLLGRLVDACNALEYAHSRGVLHRDLKPGNIMLGDYGETFVVDWGLAKLVGRDDDAATSQVESQLSVSAGSDSGRTQLGTALGTPAFMSPEQAAGRWDELGVTSDVYSLGATMYCILTGQPPIESGADWRERIEQGQFHSPREVNQRVPYELEAICREALSTNQADRYSSPRELKDDIEAWMAGSPVSTTDDSLPKKVARVARRTPQSPAYGLALLGMVVVLMDLFGQFSAADPLARWLMRAAAWLSLAFAYYYINLHRREFPFDTWAQIRAKGRNWYIWPRVILPCLIALPFLVALYVRVAEQTVNDGAYIRIRQTMFGWILVVIGAMEHAAAKFTWKLNEARFSGRGMSAARRKWGGVRLAYVAVIAVAMALALNGITTPPYDWFSGEGLVVLVVLMVHYHLVMAVHSKGHYLIAADSERSAESTNLKNAAMAYARRRGIFHHWLTQLAVPLGLAMLVAWILQSWHLTRFRWEIQFSCTLIIFVFFNLTKLARRESLTTPATAAHPATGIAIRRAADKSQSSPTNEHEVDRKTRRAGLLLGGGYLFVFSMFFAQTANMSVFVVLPTVLAAAAIIIVVVGILCMGLVRHASDVRRFRISSLLLAFVPLAIYCGVIKWFVDAVTASRGLTNGPTGSQWVMVAIVGLVWMIFTTVILLWFGEAVVWYTRKLIVNFRSNA